MSFLEKSERNKNRKTLRRDLRVCHPRNVVQSYIFHSLTLCTRGIIIVGVSINGNCEISAITNDYKCCISIVYFLIFSICFIKKKLKMDKLCPS